MYEFKPDQSNNMKGIMLTSVTFEKDTKNDLVVLDDPFDKKELN